MRHRDLSDIADVIHALQAEFDGWGVAGWTGRDLEPYLNRSERFNPLNGDERAEGHGYDGPWHTRATRPMFGYSKYFLDGMHTLGVPQTKDPHAISGISKGPVATGAWNLQVSQKSDGTRSHTGSAYLSDEILQKRPNLQLVVNASTHHVHMVGNEGNFTATGVWIVQNSKSQFERSGNVRLILRLQRRCISSEQDMLSYPRVQSSPRRYCSDQGSGLLPCSRHSISKRRSTRQESADD